MSLVTTKLQFREPVLQDAAWAVPLLMAQDALACEYSFTTIYMWRRYYKNQLAFADGQLFLKSGEGDNTAFLLPIGGDLHRGLDCLRAYAAEQGIPLLLFGADQETAERIDGWYPGVFGWTESRGDFDYLYEQSALAELPGKKYHSKRNHVAGFSKNFAWSYEPITDGNAAEVVEMAAEWCRSKGNCADRGLRSEQCAIREAMAHRQELSLTGGLLRVDGRVAAFSFGSPISRTVFDVHVEKALPAFPGAYAVINQQFSKRLSDYRYLNRENDLNVEGLRKAKLSYHPTILLEKFIGRADA